VLPRAAPAAAFRLAPSMISTPSTSSSTSSSTPLSFASQRRHRRAPAAPQAAPWAEGVEPPTSAETARTIVDITAHGTLCTSGSDGVPLGEYFSSLSFFFYFKSTIGAAVFGGIPELGSS